MLLRAFVFLSILVSVISSLLDNISHIMYFAYSCSVFSGFYRDRRIKFLKNRSGPPFIRLSWFHFVKGVPSIYSSKNGTWVQVFYTNFYQCLPPKKGWGVLWNYAFTHSLHLKKLVYHSVPRLTQSGFLLPQFLTIIK